MPESALELTHRPALVLPRQESRLRILRRRVVTVPLFLSAAGLYAAVLPFLLAGGLVADVALRRRLASVRAFAMVGVYLFCETAGIFASAAIRLRHRDPGAFIAANYRLQAWWAGTLFRAGVRLFSLRMDVDGAETPKTGPVIVMARHVSPIDNLLPVALVTVPFGLRLRWVINRSLLRDPCLDIVGNRLPNCFVQNGAKDSEAEIRRVEALARNLGPEDGVLIFPEGALFSRDRRQRVLARLEAGDDEALFERAKQLENLLPPRLGGAMALLAAAPSVDVVFIAHTGLEGATEYQSILGGGLTGRVIRVRMWRVPADDIPTAYEARVAWLFDQWAEIDRWVTTSRMEQSSA